MAQLLTYYDYSTGLFSVQGGNPFWTTANAFETLANTLLLAVGPLNATGYTHMLNNTLAKQSGAIFSDAFRDDHLWYILAFDRAVAATGQAAFRAAANTIYSDLLCTWYAWNATCGGVEWERGNPYLNAITNELFFAASERLALQPGGGAVNVCNGTTFSQWGDREWAWFNSTVMYVPAAGLFQDGLSEANCSQLSPGASIWTYNQGVILSALALHAGRSPAPASSTLLHFAAQIIQAAQAFFTASTGGVLSEVSCGSGGHCTGMDGQQFKGVFMRHLMYAAADIMSAVPSMQTFIPAFVNTQVTSILANDVSTPAPGALLMGTLWQGPFVTDGFAAVAQGAALDALLCAYALAV